MKPRMFKRGKGWVCRAVLNEPGLKGVVVIGTGRKMETAFKDYARKYNWWKRGCPGAPFWLRSKKNVNQETRAIQRACQGP